jgi:hypothetical protein
MELDPVLNWKHVNDPQPGDYWHEMFGPCYLVVDRSRLAVSYLEHIVSLEEGKKWAWDTKRVTTTSIEDFVKLLSYTSLKEKTWCDVIPNWKYGQAFIDEVFAEKDDAIL